MVERNDSPHIIAVGASAGSMQALTTMMGSLAGDLPAAIAVVLHQPRTRRARWPRSSTGPARCVPLPPKTANR